jgi:hypothetical protein
LRADSASATPRGGGEYDDGTSDGRRRIFAVLGGIVALIVVVVAVIVVTSGGGGNGTTTQSASTQVRSTSQSTNGKKAATPRRTPAAAPIPAPSITVAVLNGTAQGGLASTVASQLTQAGYRQGTITNASSQDRTATVVMYTSGHDREAKQVASALRLPADSVQPINPDTDSTCRGQTASCTATVVVTVGADRRTQ